MNRRDGLTLAALLAVFVLVVGWSNGTIPRHLAQQLQPYMAPTLIERRDSGTTAVASYPRQDYVTRGEWLRQLDEQRQREQRLRQQEALRSGSRSWFDLFGY